MQTVSVRTNLEIACSDDVIAIACRHRPDWALLVPENRQEVTTEGGLDVASDQGRVADAVARLRDAGIWVSLFLDPEPHQIDAAIALRVDAVELHTGPYALAKGTQREAELQRLAVAGQQIRQAGMRLHAGHGLNYHNVRPVAALPEMGELNIGHSIVARAVMVGFREAVAEMVGSLHQGSTHKGKFPDGLMEKRQREMRLNELGDRLKRAVDTENYEEAAGIRDEIQQLESANEQSGERS
jgi:pyridoxine 5-phosphate synthase